MKITFSDFSQSTTGEHNDLTILKVDDYLVLSIERLSHTNDVLDLISISISKDQLKDLIGVLLHVQSKLKGNGRG